MPMDCTSSGVKDRATVTATPVSYSTAGSERRSRYGLASELAAPKQSRITAICSPSTKALRIDSNVTGPPMLTATAHEGSGTCGSVKSTCPGTPRCAEEDLDHHPDHDDQHAEAQEERDGA